MNGRQVVMLFPDDGIGGRVFPAGLAQVLNQYYREKGVEVLAGELVSGMTIRGGETGLATETGGESEGGRGFARIGLPPEDHLPRAAGVPPRGRPRAARFLRPPAPVNYSAT